jgi:hypothetical protein
LSMPRNRQPTLSPATPSSRSLRNISTPRHHRFLRVWKLPTIGFLGATPSIESQRVAAFVQRLRELAWTDGRNLAIEYRWAEGRNERYAAIAAEFVRLKVDVIVTVATPPTLAAKQLQM